MPPPGRAKVAQTPGRARVNTIPINRLCRDPDSNRGYRGHNARSQPLDYHGGCDSAKCHVSGIVERLPLVVTGDDGRRVPLLTYILTEHITLTSVGG